MTKGINDGESDGLHYDNPVAYRNMVKMSARKYILVEGKSDKTSLKYLIEECFGKHSGLFVHGAHQIKFGKDMGNREVVEEISKSINDTNYAGRFVGFVDRQFDGFELEDEIKDLINKHNIINRLIWSRGHSIENYFFEFRVLRKPLRHFSPISYFDDVLELFEQHLEQTIRLACAVGLAGWECELLVPARSSIDWSILEFSKSSEIHINTLLWMESLVSKQRLTKPHAETLISKFHFWFTKVSRTNFDTIRWLCDGHTGMTFIWSAYARCVFEICKRHKEERKEHQARNVLKAEESVRFNACASEWAEMAPNKSCEYPLDIFAHLGLSS